MTAQSRASDAVPAQALLLRRHFLLHAASLASTLTLPALALADEQAAEFPPIDKRKDWSAVLGPEQFDVLFREETEYSGSSPLNAETRPGTYVCAACLLPLFDSRHKFDSGTGWPSFTQPLDRHIATRTDHRARVRIVEYHCARCGGHQGHVFRDGPPPRGERWCNNGLALQFVPAGTLLPELRK